MNRLFGNSKPKEEPKKVEEPKKEEKVEEPEVDLSVISARVLLLILFDRWRLRLKIYHKLLMQSKKS